MAEIFVSYTGKDKNWAFWLGHQLERLGHQPRLHDWELTAGSNIVEWMEARFESAAAIILVVSEAYLAAPYSAWERRAALWAAAQDRPRFALPIVIEDCEVPTLLSIYRRCELFGVDEKEAQRRLEAFVGPWFERQPDFEDDGPRAAPTSISSKAEDFPGTPLTTRLPSEPRKREGPHVVLLIHGIRDHAPWQSEVRDKLRLAGLTPISTNYGYFDVVRFLAPFPFFRNQAISRIETQIRDIRKEYKNSPISVIAHSFGTYVFAQILKRNFDMVFTRVVFCGSVLKYSFEFEQISDRFVTPVLNEVGTADIWPALAESVTWGYGAAGTFGFRRFRVEDRFHNGAGHGHFLNAKFCDDFWVPFLKRGDIQPANATVAPTQLWVRLVSIFKLKYIVLIALICMLAASSVTRYCAHHGVYRMGERDDAPFFFWNLTISKLFERIPARCTATRWIGDDSWLTRYLAQRRFATVEQSDVDELKHVVSCTNFTYGSADGERDPVAALEELGQRFPLCISVTQPQAGTFRVTARTENMTRVGKWWLCGCSEARRAEFERSH